MAVDLVRPDAAKHILDDTKERGLEIELLIKNNAGLGQVVNLHSSRSHPNWI
jgi:short-subunit dehydrogenase